MILNFEEVFVVTPRGRYDLDMFTDSLRLRGKTYDYKIVYSTISRLFLLPKDEHAILFIVSLKMLLACNSDHFVAWSKRANSTGSNKVSLPCDVFQH
jgi:hypothetical protein